MAKHNHCPFSLKTFAAGAGAVAALLVGGAGCGGERGGEAVVRPKGLPIGGGAAARAQMHPRPTAEEQKQIDEYKRTHPGAYTRP